MKTKLFYFSATGNSLSVAKELSNCVGDIELISIKDVINKTNNIKASKVGFVFPVYAYGLPRIVEDFINNIQLSEVEYAFAIATCSGIPGNTLFNLNRLLNNNGVNLNAGFVVKDKNHTFLNENIFMKLMYNISGNKPDKLKDKINEIEFKVNNNIDHKAESSSKVANFVGDIVHKIAVNQFKKTSNDFWVDDNCNLCGICVKVCPRGNIDIKDDKHIWEQKCESCFACIQWCPQEAIQYKDLSLDKKRSHHDNINIRDFINLKEGVKNE